ncbi:MAG: glycosyltransferase family 2 protein [Capsulimonadales bacterium]|nr:glycosyltransferase family 2 protein [Capsulimonadales bacterium]
MQPVGNPFLSVVMPTYNRKEVLRRALDGLAQQSFPFENFEAVVVSDGSTDGTNELLTEYAGSSPFRLRPIFQENGGPSRARNRGIREATGEVVVFLDDDMEPERGFLSHHAAHHCREDAVAVIGPMNRSTDHGNREPVWVVWEHMMLAEQYHNFREGIWEGAGPHHFYSGNASVRRRHLLAVGGFDETFKRQEDVELAFRLERQCGVRFVFDGEAAGWHRPQRSFASWKKVPYEYGRLDVVRARRGDVDWELVRHSYHSRNPLTRVLAQVAMTVPVLEPSLETGLLTLTRVLYRFRQGRSETQALLPLSVLFNLRYLKGAREEIGGARPLREVLNGGTGVRTS